MMAQAGAQLTQQAISGEKERYPVLSNTLRGVADENQPPISRFSASYMTLQEEVDSTKPTKASEPDNGVTDTVDLDDPFRDGVYNTDLTTPKMLANSESNLSAAAAAMEKSARQSGPSIEPRQNRTSSLRARLSAGHLVKDGQNKVIGFTDFTALDKPASARPRRDSLRIRKEAQARRPVTPPAASLVQKKHSLESLRANRAPAHLVAGSRRPSHPRRPSSHGSLRHDLQAAGALPSSKLPQRSAPTKPMKSGTDISDAGIADSVQAGPVTNSRDSSILVPSHAAGTRATEQTSFTSNETKKQARDEVGIYNDRISLDLAHEISSTTPSIAKENLDDDANDHGDTGMLASIEESPPPHTYQLKRLSLNTSGFGPTLRISPMAEQFIMGPDAAKTKRTLNRKQSKEIDRAMIKADLQARKDTATSTAIRKTAERPSSSQGLSQSSSSIKRVDPQTREKRVKSADLSITSGPKGDLNEAVGVPALDPSRQCLDVPFDTSKALSTVSTNDPFFDALEEPEPESGAVEPNVVSTEMVKHRTPPDEAAWISPLKEKRSNSGKFTGLDDKVPAALREQFADDLKSEVKDSAKQFTTKENDTQAKTNSEGATDGNDTHIDSLPFTPESKIRAVSSTPTFPPRSSSRIAHSEFLGNVVQISAEKLPKSSLSEEQGPPTPPKDHQTREDNRDSLRRTRASQLDFKKLVTNRESTGSVRDSHQSQPQTSKGMLSSVRGLFHKRTSENIPPKSTRKPKTKPTINSNGSPYPPITEHHSLHRPTAASLARSTPRPSTSLAPPQTPATPSYASPLPGEVSTTTTLAMQILEQSRNERSSPKKERLLELGKIMVEAITQARDAEKAMEEAKQAARRAEVGVVRCKRALGEVERCVRVWRGEVGDL